MSLPKLTRRQLLQQSAILLAGTALPATLLAEQAATSIPPGTIFIPPGGGKKGRIGRSDVSFKLDSANTSGQFGSLEMLVPPGQLGAPPHYHKNFDEICIVLEGAVHIMVEDEVTEVKKGGWHLRPRGKVHTFWNSGKKKAKVIELCSPGGHEAYMMELAAMFENNGRPAPGALNKLADKYDIIFRFDLLGDILKKYRVAL